MKDSIAFLLIVPEENETFLSGDGQNRTLRMDGYGFNRRFQTMEDSIPLSFSWLDLLKDG